MFLAPGIYHQSLLMTEGKEEEEEDGMKQLRLFLVPEECVYI